MTEEMSEVSLPPQKHPGTDLTPELGIGVGLCVFLEIRAGDRFTTNSANGSIVS